MAAEIMASCRSRSPNFMDFGIGNRNAIAPGIREVCALGFVELTRPGRAGNGEFRIPNLFRLTYLPAHGKGPTHEWRRIETIEEAERIARKVRRTIKKAQNPRYGKRYRHRYRKRYRARDFSTKTQVPKRYYYLDYLAIRQRGDTGLHSPSPSAPYAAPRRDRRARDFSSYQPTEKQPCQKLNLRVSDVEKFPRRWRNRNRSKTQTRAPAQRAKQQVQRQTRRPRLNVKTHVVTHPIIESMRPRSTKPSNCSGHTFRTTMK